MPKIKKDKPTKPAKPTTRKKKEKKAPSHEGYGDKLTVIVNNAAMKIADVLEESLLELEKIDIHGTMAMGIVELIAVNLFRSIENYRKLVD